MAAGKKSVSKMLQEVREQPAALERTLRGGLSVANDLRRYFSRRRPRRITLVARGSSDHAAEFGRYLLEITTGIPVSLAAPSVFSLYRRSLDFEQTLVVALSQSGESTDTNLVLKQARKHGAFTIGITNQGSSALARLAEQTLLVRAGKEESVAATKTYTGQMMALYLLAQALGAAGAVKELDRIPGYVEKALQLEGEVASCVQRYRFMERAVVLGRGLNYGNAFEFALKLMETSYVVAEGFSSSDFLHGPIAMIQAAFPVFTFAPAGPTWPGIARVLRRLAVAKAESVVVTDLSNTAAVNRLGRRGTGLTCSLCIPARLAGRQQPADLYTPIPYIVPAQLFAACLAELKGLDADRPRSLKKITRTL
jgi:glucosamine--fructose-6-phosphate aminotransferase (isomerizing)